MAQAAGFVGDNMDKLISESLRQGFGYALFVFLLLYVLKTTGEREKKYQELLNKLTDKFNVLINVRNDVEEIKNKLEEKQNEN